MLRDSEATVLVFDAQHDAVVADLRERGGAEDGTPVVHWLRVGADTPGWALDFDRLVDGAAPDPLVGSAGKFTIPLTPLRARVDVKTFVKLAGGEYFFLPSLPALRFLETLP